MIEFAEKDIDLNVIQLNKNMNAMVKVMREYNDGIDVKDMSD